MGLARGRIAKAVARAAEAAREEPMREFLSGLAWGAGISLGLCVGLVVWVFLRELTFRLLGISALTISKLDRIAAALEDRDCD